MVQACDLQSADIVDDRLLEEIRSVLANAA
jgi:hypothetical protein